MYSTPDAPLPLFQVCKYAAEVAADKFRFRFLRRYFRSRYASDTAAPCQLSRAGDPTRRTSSKILIDIVVLRLSNDASGCARWGKGEGSGVRREGGYSSARQNWLLAPLIDRVIEPTLAFCTGRSAVAMNRFLCVLPK